MSKFLRFFLAAVIVLSAVHSEAKTDGEHAPLREAKNLGKQYITDKEGRIFYLISLVKEEQKKYSNQRLESEKSDSMNVIQVKLKIWLKHTKRNMALSMLI